MLNPLALPAEVVSALRSAGAIERLLESRLIVIEGLLRSHLEATAELHSELVVNRREAEKLRAELGELRDALEPLEGPAKRMARLSERLPGDG